MHTTRRHGSGDLCPRDHDRRHRRPRGGFLVVRRATLFQPMVAIRSEQWRALGARVTQADGAAPADGALKHPEGGRDAAVAAAIRTLALGAWHERPAARTQDG